jgi:biofilm PGA synthesis N-glycosyltransferase PgaC
VPAHDEADGLPRALASVAAQTRPVDAVVVVADNCTDDTVPIARECGARVLETVGNVDRKAGALDAVLAVALGRLRADDAVLMMDADSELDPDFVALAAERLWRAPGRRPVGAVGGIFMAQRGPWSLVRQLQENEYVRYARHLARRRGRALVMTGTGSMFRIGALREVVAARVSGALPDLGGTRGVYDTSALTEDNELTICLKRLGYRTLSPQGCTVRTAMMPTWRALFGQRLRWQRGALENLIAHGLGRSTFPYLARQASTYLGVLFLPLYVLTLVIALATTSGVRWTVPLWLAVGIGYVLEQTWAVRRGGWRAVLVSAAVVPELMLNVFLNVVYLVSFWGALFATPERWGRFHDPPPPAPDGWRAGDAHPGPPSGTHPARVVLWARVVEVTIAVVVTALLAGLFAIPAVALPLAWTILAVYVLIGSAATLFRLVPLPMS